MSMLALAGSLHAGTFSSSVNAPAVQATDIANLGTQTGTDKWFFQTANEAGVSDAAKANATTAEYRNIGRPLNRFGLGNLVTISA